MTDLEELVQELPEDLQTLMTKDATVHHYVMHYFNGDDSYVGVLEKLVVHLCADKQALRKVIEGGGDHA